MQSNTLVYVIIPVVPCAIGKSFFSTIFQRKVQKEGFLFSKVENKEIREKHNHMYPKSNQRIKREKGTGIMFQDNLADLIQGSLYSNDKAHFIYLDKKHPPNAWPKVMSNIENARGSVNVKLVALIPTVYNNLIRDQNGNTYPFSTHLILNCLERLRGRAKPEVFQGTERESVSFSLTILKTFKNFNFKNLGVNGFDKIFSVPLSEEGDPIPIPKELEKAFQDAISSQTESFKSKESVSELIYLLKSLNLSFKQVSKERMELAIDHFFQTEIFPEVYPGYKAPISSNLDYFNHNLKENDVFKTKSQELLSKEKEVLQENNESNEFSSLKHNNSSNEYNPSRIPVSLGIFPLKSEHNVLKELLRKTALDLMKLEEIQYDPFLKTYFEDLSKENPKLSTFMENPHVTTLLINGDKEKTRSSAFKNFKPDYQMNLEISKLIVVPNKFIIALCSFDQSLIKTEQKYSQMLLTKGNEWVLNESRDFLEKLDKNGYLNGIQKEITPITIEHLGKETKVYVIKSTPSVCALSETRASRNADEI